jgi:hypothetical protein
MKATIEISESDLTAAVITNDNGEVISWLDLSRDEQVKLLNSLSGFVNLFSRFIKEK